jgi:serine/threonine-protein kinase
VSPFFSPDGTWVGFFADRRLKRVPVGGGAAVDIARAPGRPAGASWGVNDRIVFAGYQAPLQVVEAAGGTPEDVLPDGAGWGLLFPDYLPDGRTVLFTEGRSTYAVDLVTKRRTDRILEGIGARYSASGYLLLNRGNMLLAAPFDTSTLSVTGALLPVVEGVDFERTTNGAAHMAISGEGTVAFAPSARAFELVLVEPDGRERLVAEHPMLQNPQFSPNGQRLAVAVSRNSGERPDVWIHDLIGASPAYRLTSEGGSAPLWTRDGVSVTYAYPPEFSRKADDVPGIYNRSADGRGDAQQVTALPAFHWLVGWTPNQSLVYGIMEATAIDQAPASSIFVLDGGESKRVVGPGHAWGGRLSPDGHWLAYYSLDSGYFEIYVTPFPNTGTRSLIAEGTDPVWSPDGSEIYFRAGSRLMAARVETSPALRVLSRRLVVEPFIPPLYDDYDIHPDGRTLALVRPAGELRGREIALLLNWPAELQRLNSR